MGNTLVPTERKRNQENRYEANHEYFQSQDMITGHFNYQVVTNDGAVHYKHLVRFDLNSEKDQIIADLNQQINTIPPDNAGDMAQQLNMVQKGFFTLKEVNELQKIVFVFPNNATEVVFLDNGDDDDDTPSILPFLGIEMTSYKIPETTELEIQISTNRDITLLKYYEDKLKKKLDDVKYSENLEKTRRIITLKELNSNKTTSNEEILEYKEAWYIKYLHYLKIIFIVLSVIVLLRYVSMDKNRDYFSIIVVIAFIVYCLF